MHQARAAALTNLPVRRTRLIGRAHDLAAVRGLLLHAEGRLLTLTGAGGSGKTVLAQEIARGLLDAFDDGVWLVELASLADPALVLQAIAPPLGVRESPDRPLLDGLIDYLQPRALLLVLDNCEHLVDACAALCGSLLTRCPDLRILATSREGLRIIGETVWRVPSLASPGTERAHDLDALSGYPAVQLFVERARAVLPSFELTPTNGAAVAKVCGQLDGIPLALELAAARVRVLPVEQLAARLDSSFRLLTGGSRIAPNRQQTLAATLDWSYDLLSPTEQVLFRRLAVFAGGFDLEAAEAVAGGEAIEPAETLELLTHLVDKSLVLAEDLSGEARYRLLEPIRQYGRERLRGSGDEERTRRRHAEHFLKLAEAADSKLRGPEQAAWFGRLERELDNLRASLAWAEEHGDLETVLRLASGLWWFWRVRGPLREGLRWLEAATSTITAVPPSVQARALTRFGHLAWARGDFQQTLALADDILDQCRRVGDEWDLGVALLYLGNVAADMGDWTVARARLEEGLTFWQALGDGWGIGASLTNLGILANYQGDYSLARPLLEDGLAQFRAIGERFNATRALTYLASTLRNQGDTMRAAALAVEGLEMLRQQVATREIALCLEVLAGVAIVHGRAERAAHLFGAAERLREQIGVPLVPADRAAYERGRAAVRQTLGAEVFAAAWTRGRTMLLEQAITEALFSIEPERSRADPLTPREREVVALIARGHTNRQVAEALVISTLTADRHVHNILAKLGLSTRTQIAAWTLRQGPK